MLKTAVVPVGEKRLSLTDKCKACKGAVKEQLRDCSSHSFMAGTDCEASVLKSHSNMCPQKK